jgi:acetyl coenzyme A synthetase (ADP forming)-like protein
MDDFFNPRSVAVIGASEARGKVGYAVIKNILEYGFPGKVYPINPNARTILGTKAYRSVLEVEGEIDLGVIVIPPLHIPAAIEELGRKGTKAVVVISAGFKETGPEGAQLEAQVLAKVRQFGMRMVGPNCLGIISTHSRLNASFSTGVPPQGNIAFFSQSGALCTAILDWAIGEGIGFSKFISIGNKADLGEVEFLRYLADDPQTAVILGYIEGVTKGREFMEAATYAAGKKPLIMTKSGGTAAGAKAAASHTGTLAGSEKAFDAAFKQCGIIRANTIEDLFDFAIAFSYQSVPRGPNLAIITNAGGPGIMAADAVERSEISMASLTKDTVEKLRGHLPPVAALHNPVDIIGDGRADRYRVALETVIQDPQVDGVVVILTPQEMTEVEATAEIVGEVASRSEKPVLTSFMGKKSVQEGQKILRERKIPNYAYPEHAVRSFEAMVKYKRFLDRPGDGVQSFEVDREKVRQIIRSALEEERYSLGETEAREIIAAYGFSVPRNLIAATSVEAVAAAESIGYPVVLKIVSPDILHKSDIGGVKVGVTDAEAVRKAFQEIISNAQRFSPTAHLVGVAVQEMVTAGKEVILGISKDPQFGPLLMFGLGGIYVEVLKDVSFRICPVSRLEASSMVREIRSFPLLRGVRGEKSADLVALEEALMRLSQLAVDFPEIIEGDINPLKVRYAGEGSVAIDARFIVKEVGG